MKYLLSLLVLGLLLVGAVIGGFWLKVRPADYPFVRTITGPDGRSAEFRIVGKDDEHFYFYRTGDTSESPALFDMEISSTDLVNRAILLSMPQQAPPQPKEEKDPYITNREKQISRLQEKLTELRADKKESSSKKIGAIREWAKEEAALNSEIEELMSDISDFKER